MHMYWREISRDNLVLKVNICTACSYFLITKYDKTWKRTNTHIQGSLEIVLYIFLFNAKMQMTYRSRGQNAFFPKSFY